VGSWAKWLDKHYWQFWVTLTFAEEVNLTSAIRRFNRWTRDLALRGGARVDWFAAYEYGAANQLHIHVLLAGAASLTRDDIRDAWRFGLTHVVRFHRGGNASRYVSKVVADPRGFYDISRRLTRS
jgi:hypothetical protein